MDSRTFGRALLCASIIGAGAVAMPGVASAAPANFDCYPGTSANPTPHEVGEAEGDAYCTPNVGDAPIAITGVTSPEVTVRNNNTPYASLVYTGAIAGPDHYDFTASDGTDTQVYTAYVTNRAATNDPPQCLGQQSGDGEALAIGMETFAAGCFDDEGETGNVTITIVKQPSRGTLRIDNSDPTSPLVYYKAACSGADTYSLKASDGVNESQVYTAATTNAAGVPCSTPPAPPAAPPAAKPAAPAPVLKFSLKKVPANVTLDSKGNAVFSITGTPGSKGSVVISSDKAITSAKKKKKAKKAILMFARKGFKVPASGVAKVKFKVTAKALKALKKAKKIKVKVTIKTDKTTVTKRITLKAPKAKAKAKRKAAKKRS